MRARSRTYIEVEAEIWRGEQKCPWRSRSKTHLPGGAWASVSPQSATLLENPFPGFLFSLWYFSLHEHWNLPNQEEQTESCAMAMFVGVGWPWWVRIELNGTFKQIQKQQLSKGSWWGHQSHDGSRRSRPAQTFERAWWASFMLWLIFLVWDKCLHSKH